MNTTKRILLIVFALVLLTASALMLLGYIELPRNNPTPSPSLEPNAAGIAPDEILGMNKMVVSSGEDALEIVKRSHSGSIEHIKDVAIVHYVNMKEGKFMTLWTTQYPNETIANDETERMVVGMQKWGGSWASNLKELTIAEKQVYQTSSDNVTHYFWADQEWVFYIIPHDFTEDEIAEVIGAIPRR
ncbi:MAG: hypothetical protein U9O85_02130 [Euryarchaeota archaeon]|nr:hypothetical protein [Euryarchaeota archaeon]